MILQRRLGMLGDRHRWSLKGDPDEAVADSTGVAQSPSLGRDRSAFRLGRDGGAAPGPVVAPAVVGAHQGTALHASQGEGGAPVDTQVFEGPHLVTVAPQDEPFA